MVTLLTALVCHTQQLFHLPGSLMCQFPSPKAEAEPGIACRYLWERARAGPRVRWSTHYPLTAPSVTCHGSELPRVPGEGQGSTQTPRAAVRTRLHHRDIPQPRLSRALPKDKPTVPLQATLDLPEKGAVGGAVTPQKRA